MGTLLGKLVYEKEATRMKLNCPILHHAVAIMLSTELVFTSTVYATDTSDFEKNYTQDTEVETQEVPTLQDDSVVSGVVDVESIVSKTDEAHEVFYNTYVIPIDTAVNLSTGETESVKTLVVNTEAIVNELNTEHESPEWDYRKRVEDIYILSEILVNQFGVSKTKASAIIANCCFEDTFIALTTSEAYISTLEEMEYRFNNASRGFGIAQWTQKKRRLALEEYYRSISQNYSWDMTSIIAETAYLYNELTLSGMIGDLSADDMSLEQCTGILACEYEKYEGHEKDWVVSNGNYTSKNAARYNYAVCIYDMLTE